MVDEHVPLCRGCQRPGEHLMCPAYGTPFYCSGIPFTEEIEKLFPPIGERISLRQRLAAVEARCFKIATEAQTFHEEAEMYKRHSEDLTILVRLLCYQIKDDENSVKRLALDYLKRTGREASVLRDGEFANIKAALAAGGSP